MSKETLGKDINGAIDFTLPFPISGARTTLAPSVEQTFAAPAGFNRVYFTFSPGTSVFVGMGSTPISVPSGSFVSSTIEQNPAGRQLSGNGTETLRFISDTAAYVTMRFDSGS
jgi:hypothetical protein